MTTEEAAEILRRVGRGRDVFIHKRYINANREPERCYITSVTRRNGAIGMIYYRVGTPTGFLTKCTAAYFVGESFKEWG